MFAKKNAKIAKEHAKRFPAEFVASSLAMEVKGGRFKEIDKLIYDTTKSLQKKVAENVDSEAANLSVDEFALLIAIHVHTYDLDTLSVEEFQQDSILNNTKKLVNLNQLPKRFIDVAANM